jgi:hypothetical protein
MLVMPRRRWYFSIFLFLPNIDFVAVAVRNSIQTDASPLSKLIMPKRRKPINPPVLPPVRYFSIAIPVKSTTVAPVDENGDDVAAPEAVEFSK